MVAHDFAREAGEDRRPDRAPRPLSRLPARRGGGAEDAVRQDPASDRSATATVATTSGMSIASNHRWQPEGRGVSMIDREPPNAARSGGASLMMRLNGSEAADWRPPTLAQMRRNDASSALGSRPPGNPGQDVVARQPTTLRRSVPRAAGWGNAVDNSRVRRRVRGCHGRPRRRRAAGARASRRPQP